MITNIIGTNAAWCPIWCAFSTRNAGLNRANEKKLPPIELPTI